MLRKEIKDLITAETNLVSAAETLLNNYPLRKIKNLKVLMDLSEVYLDIEKTSEIKTPTELAIDVLKFASTDIREINYAEITEKHMLSDEYIRLSHRKSVYPDVENEIINYYQAESA